MDFTATEVHKEVNQPDDAEDEPSAGRFEFVSAVRPFPLRTSIAVCCYLHRLLPRATRSQRFVQLPCHVKPHNHVHEEIGELSHIILDQESTDFHGQVVMVTPPCSGSCSSGMQIPFRWPPESQSARCDESLPNGADCAASPSLICEFMVQFLDIEAIDGLVCWPRSTFDIDQPSRLGSVT